MTSRLDDVIINTDVSHLCQHCSMITDGFLDWISITRLSQTTPTNDQQVSLNASINQVTHMTHSHHARFIQLCEASIQFQ